MSAMKVATSGGEGAHQSGRVNCAPAGRSGRRARRRARATRGLVLETPIWNGMPAAWALSATSCARRSYSASVWLWNSPAVPLA